MIFITNTNIEINRKHLILRHIYADVAPSLISFVGFNVFFFPLMTYYHKCVFNQLHFFIFFLSFLINALHLCQHQLTES